MTTLNMWSGAGNNLVYPAASPGYANLLPGLEYEIILRNTTNADITAGTINIEGASAQEDDPCTPGTWGPIDAIPECTAPPGTPSVHAQIELSATHGVKANSQCAVAFPCPTQFIRLTGVPAGISAFVVVSRLRRTVNSFGLASGETWPASGMAAHGAPLPASYQSQPAETRQTKKAS